MCWLTLPLQSMANKMNFESLSQSEEWTTAHPWRNLDWIAFAKGNGQSSDIYTPSHHMIAQLYHSAIADWKLPTRHLPKETKRCWHCVSALPQNCHQSLQGSRHPKQLPWRGLESFYWTCMCSGLDMIGTVPHKNHILTTNHLWKNAIICKVAAWIAQ